MGKSGLSAVWHDASSEREIQDLPLPEAEHDGISIRVQVTSIWASDLHACRGDGKLLGQNSSPSAMPGHEMMGFVAATGSIGTPGGTRTHAPGSGGQCSIR